MKSIAALLSIVSLLAVSLPAHAQWWYGGGSSSSSGSRSSGRATGGTTFGGAVFGYPIGTTTNETPRIYGAPGLSPAPGVSSSTGNGLSPGQFFYYNNPGTGYYRANPTASQYPAYPAPIALGGGYFQLGGLTERVGYWRAPSGYYYPWCPPIYMTGVSYSPTPVIYAINQGLLTPSQPSVGAILADMRQFIESAKEKNQLDQSNYENFFRRLNEVTARSSELSAKNGGALTISDEQIVRREIDLLSADLARSLNP